MYSAKLPVQQNHFVCSGVHKSSLSGKEIYGIKVSAVCSFCFNV